MWIYVQKTGGLHYSGDPTSVPRFQGYSGVLPYRNDPEKQCYLDLGPIPRGMYTMSGVQQTPTELSITLTPDALNEMCGRSNFLIHGDSIKFPGSASEGCIIISGIENRKLIWESRDHMLEVIWG
jgi:hypothetical protein